MLAAQKNEVEGTSMTPATTTTMLTSQAVLGGVAAVWGETVLRFTSEHPMRATGDFATAAALLPVLSTVGQTRMTQPLSAPLAASLPRIADVFAGWDAQFSRGTLWPADGQAPAVAPAEGVGSFFSGGVDSFYTLLTNLDRITHIIFVAGFDLSTSTHPDIVEQAVDVARKVGAELGKEVVVVATDVRSTYDGLVPWPYAHGPALAAVAHALSPVLGTVLIPATYHVDHLFPWGSHPDVDSLWSGDATAIEHDGAEATRATKVERIAQSDLALAHLRVCWRNLDRAYNCGRCEKCLRTMMSLAAVDSLDRCGTLARNLPWRLILSSGIYDEHAQAFARATVQLIRTRGGKPRSVAWGLRWQTTSGFPARVARRTFRMMTRTPLAP
jgi:hypothetical protein